MNGLIDGLLHPLLVPAHAIALVALGLLAGQRAMPRRFLLLGLFAAALALGLVAIARGAGPTPAGDVVVAAAAVAGLVVAVARVLPAPVEGTLAAVLGAAVALDSPPEVVSLQTATLMLTGTGIGAALLVGAVAAIAGALTRDWQRIGIRVLGSWMAASAILVLALRFAGD
jgi:urease accessory protein